MSPFSRHEAADRAGVSLTRLNQLVDLGILIPSDDDRFSSGDVRRVGLVQSLEDAGIPPEGLAAAIGSGELSLAFMDSEAYERFSSLSPITFQELSEETGVPVDLLMVVREASGSAQPTPQDRLRDGELAVVPFLEIQVAEGFRPVAIERLLRATGDGLSRITASEGNWWRSEVLTPRTGAEVASDTAVDPEVLDRIMPLAEQAMVAMYHAQQGMPGLATSSMALNSR